MSYLFDGVDDHLTHESDLGGTDAAPLTISLWFKSTSSTAAQNLASIGASGSGNHRFTMTAQGSVAGDPVRATARTSSDGSADTTTGYSPNVWHHAAGVYVSATDRSAFIGGGSEGTNATSITPTASLINQFRLGLSHIGGAPFAGRLAEVAVWNIALSDAQVALLAGGDNPETIQAANLVGYWRLKDDANDRTANVRHLTVTGATLDADHPTVDEPPGGGQSATLTPASETDTAQALSFSLSRTLTPVLEADTAQLLGLGPTLVPALEVDTAQGLSVTGGGGAPQPPDTNPDLGGVFDQASTGGVVVAKARSGVVDEPSRSGVFDETATGGEVL